MTELNSDSNALEKLGQNLVQVSKTIYHSPYDYLSDHMANMNTDQFFNNTINYVFITIVIILVINQVYLYYRLHVLNGMVIFLSSKANGFKLILPTSATTTVFRDLKANSTCILYETVLYVLLGIICFLCMY